MNQGEDLISKIQDRSRPIKKRVRYIKSAWKSEDVNIPNKEVFLIDTLVGYLLNRKRKDITEDENAYIWRHLCKIISSESRGGLTLLVKPSLSQVLIDGLTEEYRRCHDNSFDHVTSSCYAVITSSSLSHVFTSSLQTLGSLLHAVLVVTIQSIQDNRELPTLCIELLNRVSVEYQVVHRACDDIRKVLKNVTSRLMVPVLTLCWLTSENGHDNLRPSSTILITMLENVIFEKELTAFYGKFLHNVETHSHPHKQIEQITDTLSSMINHVDPQSLLNPDSSQKAALQYLPRFYRKFISRKCHNDSLSYGHKMLMYLFKMIGINLEDSTSSLGGQDRLVLRTVYHLLKSVHELNLYQVAQDNAAGGQQLKSYRSLLDVILNMQRCEWFYGCLEIFLSLNHLIMEARITDVLQYAWLRKTSWGLDCVMSKSLGSFLSTLIKTYSKLRHWIKWLEFVLTAVSQSDNTGQVLLPDFFITSFGECMVLLPQTVMIEIWEKFSDEIKSQYLPKLSSTSEDDVIKTHLSVVTELFTNYLSFIRVADYTVTAQTTNQVKVKLEVTANDIIIPLLDSALQQQSCDLLSIALMLLDTYGELCLLLARYTGHNIGVLSDSAMSGDIHPGCLVSSLTTDTWKHVQKLVEKKKDYKLKAQLRHLDFVTLRAMLISDPVKKGELNSPLTELAKVCVSLPTLDRRLVSWDGRMHNISKYTYPTAICAFAIRSLPVCIAFLEPADLQCLVDFLLQHEADINSVDKSTQDLLSLSGILTDFPHLQSCVLSSSLRLLTGVLSTYTDLSKRKKRRGIISQSMDLIETLTDTEITWTMTEVNGTAKEILHKASQSLSQILVIHDQCDLALGPVLQTVIKHIRSLPLSHLSDTEKFRCILAVSLSLHLVTVTIPCQHDLTQEVNQSGIFDDCVKALAILLQSCHKSSSFHLVQIEDYLSWLLYLYCWSQGREDSQYMLELLIRVSCKLTVTDRDCLMALHQTLDKLQVSPENVTSQLTKDLEAKLLLLSTLYQELCKLLNLRTVDKDLCNKHLSTLSTMTEALVSHIRKSELSPPGRLSTCYNTWLTIRCYKGGAMEKTERKNFDYMVKMSMKTLQSDSCVEKKIDALCLVNILCMNCSKVENLLAKKTKHSWISILQEVISSKQESDIQEEVEAMLIEAGKEESMEEINREVKDTEENDKSGKVNGDVGMEVESESEITKSVSPPDGVCSNELDKSYNVSSFIHQKSKDAKGKKKFEKVDTVEEDHKHLKLWKKVIHEMCIQRNKVKADKLIDILLNELSVESTLTENKTENEEESYNVDWRTYREMLIVEGRYIVEGYKVIRMMTHKAVIALIVSLDIEAFKTAVVSIIMSTTVRTLVSGSISRVHKVLCTWCKLLESEVSGEKRKILKFSAGEVLNNFIAMLKCLSQTEQIPPVRKLGIHILKTVAKMLSYHEEVLDSEKASLCLQCCKDTPIHGEAYFDTFTAVYKVVDNYLIFHTNSALNNYLEFLQCTYRLMSSVICEGSQDKLTRNPELVPIMVRCAQMMERLYGTMMEHRIVFSKQLVQIIVNYTTEVQKVTLHPEVKRALVPAMYRVLQFFNKHAKDLLRKELKPETRELFRALYADYENNYKYTDESVSGTTTAKIMSRTVPPFDKLLQNHILQRQT